MRNLALAAVSVVMTSVADAGSLVGSHIHERQYIDGFDVVTLAIEADPGQSFRGIEASFDGPMNQQLAAGIPTPTTDFDLFLPDGGVADTKFLFANSGILGIGIAESDTSLVGAISGLASLPEANPRPFARIVLPPSPRPVFYRLSVDLGGPEAEVFTGYLVHRYFFPEPSTALLAGLALVGLAARRV